MSSVPTPSIYLRNHFTLQGLRNRDFLAGKEQLLRSTQSHWKLIAGCGERGLKLGQNLPEPALKMTHIWELDSWPLLYESMYELSEAKWYRALGDTVPSEDQQLLVNFASGYGVVERSRWASDAVPGYRYLYEELMLSRTTTMHAYLRELNWLAAQLSRSGFVRTLCARHITGRPGMICLMWQVPARVEIEACLDRLAEGETAARYARMLQSVGELSRRVLQPMYTERLDERIRAGESAPIVGQDSGPDTDQAGSALPAVTRLIASNADKGELHGSIHASS
jgi:hypothetical protein